MVPHFKKRFLVFLLSLALICIPNNNVKSTSLWFCGVIHTHTTFTDGSDSIPQRVARAKKESCQFIIITDHHEQIACKQKVGNFAGRDFGFADYFRNCQEQTNTDFITIAGAEIDCMWLPEPNAQMPARSHTLALGIKPEDYPNFNPNSEIEKLQCKFDTQNEILKKLNELGYLAIAAHPNLLATESFPFFWEWQDYRYDLRSGLETYKLLNGIEMFNTETEKQQEDLVREYVKLGAAQVFIAATAGCDSHGWHDTGDDERWTHKTWICTDDFSQAGILEAIKNGQTYAARSNAHLENINLEIGFNNGYQKIEKPVFRFDLVFDKPSQNPQTIQVYRNGKLIENSKQNFSAGDQVYNYNFLDDEFTNGQACYHIEVMNTIITSPILMEIEEKQKNEDPNPLSPEPLPMSNIYKGQLVESCIGKPSQTQEKNQNLVVLPDYPTNIFNTRDTIWIYARFTNFPGEHHTELIWYDPNGNIMLRQKNKIAENSNRCDDIILYRHNITKDMELIGQYKADLFWDGQKMATFHFRRY